MVELRHMLANNIDFFQPDNHMAHLLNMRIQKTKSFKSLQSYKAILSLDLPLSTYCQQVVPIRVASLSL